MEMGLTFAGRTDDMSHQKLSLQIEQQRDGDIRVMICDDGVPPQHEGKMLAVEFCNPAGGGGLSPRTRNALIEVMYAMADDAREHPEGIPKYPIHLKEMMLGKEKKRK